jgi:hypothetical protein
MSTYSQTFHDVMLEEGNDDALDNFLKDGSINIKLTFKVKKYLITLD